MEVIPGDNRVTMVTEGLHEDWFLIPQNLAGTGEGGGGVQNPFSGGG